MHHVIGGIRRLDRQEGAGADMQGQRDTADPRRSSAASRSGVKCRPGGGRRDRPVMGGERGLVVAPVALVGPQGRLI